MRKYFVIFLTFIFGVALHAEEKTWYSFEPKTAPEHPRNFVISPLASLVMPGFDQWWEHQYFAASFYTGYAVAGTLIGLDALNRGLPDDVNDLSDRDSRVREYQLGNQMILDAGLMSAYHSFRTAVRTQQSEGKFLFLKHEETLDDIYSAPFAFAEVKKPTTYVPLILAFAAGLLDIGSQTGRPHVNAGDAFYSFADSYGAGTAEESFFRGWMMPVGYHYTQNLFWSNTGTALIFGAAHISGDNSVPLPQFILGWYLGYLTQRNEWTLKQSIFIHTWWDIIVFTTSYYSNSRHKEGALVLVPLINLTF